MKRRDFLHTTALAATALATAHPAVALVPRTARRAPARRQDGDIYVNPVTGDDTGAGTGNAPLRTLAEAARRVSRSSGSGPLTVVLAEGIHVVSETAHFKTESRAFSRAGRLTIRAEVLPDDPAWHYGRMPTLVHTLPLRETWNGRPDPLGGAADGMVIDTSHVTVQGLRVLGTPVVESPVPGQIRRLYAISRLRRDLDDLEVAQCLFVGDHVIAPNHVSIIALGNGVVVTHCVFRGLKINVVYWQAGSTGHAMRHCVCDDLYGSAVWTSGIANDFDYRGNVVVNSNYVWTNQSGASAQADAGGSRARSQAAPGAGNRYRVIDSYFANNRRLAGTGTGARLEYTDIDPSFLEMVGTTVTATPIELEHDATKRTWLHPVAGSEAAKVGAGLFTKTPS